MRVPSRRLGRPVPARSRSSAGASCRRCSRRSSPSGCTGSRVMLVRPRCWAWSAPGASDRSCHRRSSCTQHSNRHQPRSSSWWPRWSSMPSPIDCAVGSSMVLHGAPHPGAGAGPPCLAACGPRATRRGRRALQSHSRRPFFFFFFFFSPRRSPHLPPSGSSSRVAGHGRGGFRYLSNGLRAGPGSDHPFQGIPPAEAQDAGVHQPRGRPLRHPPDPHPAGDADRTVAGRGAVAQRDLAEAIALGHDVGHSPFGHTGEEALSPYFPRDGWHHAAQSVRIFEVAGGPQPDVGGARRYPGPLVEDRAAASHPGGICVRFADRIAYLSHDALDAMRAGVLDGRSIFRRSSIAFGEPGSGWIAELIEAVIEHSCGSGRRHGPGRWRS